MAARDRHRARALGGLAALRGRRDLGAALGAAGIAFDFPPHRRRLRALLPTHTAYDVFCETGDSDATPPTPASSSTPLRRWSRPAPALELLDTAAAELGIWLYPTCASITAPTAWRPLPPATKER